MAARFAELHTTRSSCVGLVGGRGKFGRHASCVVAHTHTQHTGREQFFVVSPAPGPPLENGVCGPLQLPVRVPLPCAAMIRADGTSVTRSDGGHTGSETQQQTALAVDRFNESTQFHYKLARYVQSLSPSLLSPHNFSDPVRQVPKVGRFVRHHLSDSLRRASLFVLVCETSLEPMTQKSTSNRACPTLETHRERVWGSPGRRPATSVCAP